MKFKELASYLEKLEKTASRNQITEILAELFKKASAQEIDLIIYLLLGGLAPKYESIVFNLADRMMIRVVANAYDKDPKEVTSSYKKTGDLGIVAEKFANDKGQDFSITQVFENLRLIAIDEGEGSQDRKVVDTAKLLSCLDSLSVRYVTRIPVGKLRLGFSDRTIIDALSWMIAGDKSESLRIKEAYNVIPDVGALAKKIKKEGLEKALTDKTPMIGIPVAPMLAQRLKSTDEMIKKMGVVSVEPKFDGLRLLIHFRRKDYPKKGDVEIIKAFTRNMNSVDISVFPELFEIGQHINANEVILDTEAVGMDQKREQIVDFQKTIQRRRKHDIGEASKKTPLQFQVFDILLKDKKSFLNTPYQKRRSELESVVKDGTLLRVDEYEITDDPKRIKDLHEKYLGKGLEGVIVKKADSLYVSGRTGWRWVKMKEVEGTHAKLADTVDGVVMGYTRGKGRRATFGVGQFLVGVRHKDKIQTATKVGTGITDLQFKKLNKKLEKIRAIRKPGEYDVPKILEPDFWVEPKLVVELAADEITKSPTHTSGYALRFPRLIKFREDKSFKEATTKSELVDIFNLQKN